MLPFIVLVISALLLKVIGVAGVDLLNSWTWCLRGGLAVMFLLAASAHWGKLRADLIAMVPSAFQRPDLIVSATGVLEILGAVGLLIPAIAPVAAACLAMLLISLFSANIRAAREGLMFRGAGFTEFQRSMFRAGHAHAGVLTILALVAMVFTDQAGLSAPIGWAVRIGFAAAPVLVGAGFFGAAIGNGRTQPGGLIALLWIGVFVLGGCLIVLGTGLIRARG